MWYLFKKHRNECCPHLKLSLASVQLQDCRCHEVDVVHRKAGLLYDNNVVCCRFSVGQLPLWAKKQMADNSSPPASLANRHMDLPKGRWAQRLDAGGITVKSVYDSDSIIQIPLGQGNTVQELIC
jgi:hypothetical protein